MATIVTQPTTNPVQTHTNQQEETQMSKFAPTYTVKGIELDEISQTCIPTGRCLPYNPDGNLFEMQAEAADKDGNRYYVYWIFANNGEASYDEYDYDQPDDCELID